MEFLFSEGRLLKEILAQGPKIELERKAGKRASANSEDSIGKMVNGVE